MFRSVRVCLRNTKFFSGRAKARSSRARSLLLAMTTMRPSIVRSLSRSWTATAGFELWRAFTVSRLQLILQQPSSVTRSLCGRERLGRSSPRPLKHFHKVFSGRQIMCEFFHRMFSPCMLMEYPLPDNGLLFYVIFRV